MCWGRSQIIRQLVSLVLVLNKSFNTLWVKLIHSSSKAGRTLPTTPLFLSFFFPSMWRVEYLPYLVYKMSHSAKATSPEGFFKSY
jgi:hypothetical protein